MFEGLSGLDWVFIVAALALGFGVVKFALSEKPGQKAAAPSAVSDATVPQEPPGKAAEANTRPPTWFELLDIPQTASTEDIEHAFERKCSQFVPGSPASLMTDLKFIADGGLDRSMPKDLQLRSIKAAVMAQQLKATLDALLHDIAAARHEGLMRRRQGQID